RSSLRSAPELSPPMNNSKSSPSPPEKPPHTIASPVIGASTTGAQRRHFLTDPNHKHVFQFTPKHGSWLNQVELWFSTLTRRWLKRGDFASAEDFTTRLQAYLVDHNENRAHPYRWTYTGQPLVRATPFSQTRRQQRFGRAWLSPRPQRFERAFYPPRPYHRPHGPLATNL